MCTYNGAKYLREQLDSIISQTYPIYELIIQDDCSTDDTVDIIKEYMEKYSYIKLYINEHNLGFNQNFKSACMKATGDYVAISDQDDVWFPEKNAKQVESIGNHDICCSSYLRGEKQINAKIIDLECNFERLLFSNPVMGHTMLCQLHFIQDESNWISSIWYDWSLSLHASLQHGIIKLKEPLVFHRKHANEVSTIEFAKTNSVNQINILKPYVEGFKKYKVLQKNSNRKVIYTYFSEKTDLDHFRLVHHLCELLLKEDLLSILRLCRLCQRNRHSIYWEGVKGIRGWIRGFFIPMIHAYFHSILYKDFSINNSEDYINKKFVQ